MGTLRPVRHLPLALFLTCLGGCTEKPPASAVDPQSPPVAADDAQGEELSTELHGMTSSRPEQDIARDADRKPQQVMDFFEIEPGDKVVELMAGGGYYVHLLSERVGPEGKVWAHNSPFVLERFAEKLIAARMTLPGLDNVQRLDTPLDAPELPRDLDAVLMVLFFHDTYWQEVDRTKMLESVFNSLKPGGVFGVVDHHAEAGSGERDVKTIHRIDAALVKQEVEAAGFVLDAESDILQVSADDRTKSVFLPEMRGKSDRFVYRFRKPG